MKHARSQSAQPRLISWKTLLDWMPWEARHRLQADLGLESTDDFAYWRERELIAAVTGRGFHIVKKKIPSLKHVLF